jgi:hypothetical protein
MDLETTEDPPLSLSSKYNRLPAGHRFTVWHADHF